MGLDNKSVSDYKRNKGGDITYGGLLSPIEKLESSAYDYGTDIPDKDVLEKNRTAISSNWMRENPTLGEPSEFDLLKYTKDNYSQRGTNTINLQLERQRKNRNSKIKQVPKKVAQEYRDNINAIEYNGENNPTGFIGNDPNKIRERIENSNSPIYLKNDEWTISSKTLKDDGYMWDTDSDTPKVGVGYKSAFDGKKHELAQKVFDGNYNQESKRYNFRKGDIHGANGEIFKEKDLNNLELIGIASFATGKGNLNKENKDNNDEVYFLTEFADENGVRDKKLNKHYFDNVNKDKGTFNMREWVAFRDDKGRVYYKSLGEEQLVVQQVINEVIDADVNDINNQRKDTRAGIDEKKNEIIKEKKVYKAFRKKIMTEESYVKNIEDNILSKNEIPSKNIAIVQSLIQAFTDVENEGKENFNSYLDINNETAKSIMGIIPIHVAEMMQDDNVNVTELFNKFFKDKEEEFPDDIEGMNKIRQRWSANFNNLTGRNIK